MDRQLEIIRQVSKIMREREDDLIREMLVSSASTCDPGIDSPTEMEPGDI